MDKKWGDWLLDFAKYIATVAVVYPFLSGLPKTWLYYLSVTVCVSMLVVWGLYLTKPKKPDDGETEKESASSPKSTAIPAAPAAVEAAVSDPTPAVVSSAVIASVSADANAVVADTAVVDSTPPPDVLPSDEPLPHVPESGIRSDE
jgi:hypothetical protein